MRWKFVSAHRLEVIRRNTQNYLPAGLHGQLEGRNIFLRLDFCPYLKLKWLKKFEFLRREIAFGATRERSKRFADAPLNLRLILFPIRICSMKFGTNFGSTKCSERLSPSLRLTMDALHPLHWLHSKRCSLLGVFLRKSSEERLSLIQSDEPHCVLNYSWLSFIWNIFSEHSYSRVACSMLAKTFFSAFAKIKD